MQRLFLLCYLLFLDLHADIKSTQGSIHFKVNGEDTKMILNETGLSIGTTQDFSSNLNVTGNVIISDSLTIGSAQSSTSNLHIYGSIGFNLNTYSTNTTLGDSSYNLIDSSTGNIIVTLPYAANVAQQKLVIKKISSNHEVTIRGGGNLIDNFDQLLLTETNGLTSAVSLISDGQQWRILSSPTTGLTNLTSYSPSDNTLSVWFDASDSSTIALNNGNVSQWNDKSGNSDHATQASANMQPKLLNDKLFFQGIQALTASGISNLSTWSTNRTIVALVSYEGTASNTILHWGAGSSTYRDEQFVVSTTAIQIVDGHSNGTPSFSTTTSNVDNGMLVIYSADSDATINREIRTNGTSIFSNNSDRTSDIIPDGNLFIGHDFDGKSYRNSGSFANNVYLHEIIIYPSKLSTEESQTVEGYLMHKWGLTDKLSDSHPYRYKVPAD